MSRKAFTRTLFISLVSILLAFVLLEFTGYYINWRNISKWRAFSVEKKLDQKPLKGLQAKGQTLRKKIDNLSPRGVYIVIDTASNILSLRKGATTLREAVISSGSGNILEEPGGERRWVFDTPRGSFSVKSKIRNPSWVKPDWAFIEEAEPIPKDANERIEYGVLGDYALGFGHGYFIHGTLYTRLLGRSITHGCIRVGDDDLKALFSVVTLGTIVFIF